MERGDKLFRVNGDGVLEVVTYMEESLAGPDCTVTTYLVREKGEPRQVRVSKGMYVRTVVDAWERYLRELEDCVPAAEKEALAVAKHLERIKSELGRAKEALLAAGGCVRVADVFTCPDCGSHRLEEVMKDVIQESDVVGVALTAGGLACEYGAASHDGGEVVHYRCGQCGTIIAESEEEMVAFFSKKAGGE